jgi:Phage integrase family
MIVCDALTGMRRSELMGLQWCDLDFFELRINIVRSVVDQVIGHCKTEASRKPVVMDEHIAQALKAWRQESMYTAPTDWVWASPQKQGRQPLWLATVNTVLHPAGSTTGRYYQENRLAHLPAHVLDVNQVAGRRREGCPGTPAACLFQNDDGWLHAGIGSTQTPGTSSFGGPDHAHGQGWTRMNLTIVVECCGNYDQDASKLLILWRPRRDLNPCYRRERAMS